MQRSTEKWIGMGWYTEVWFVEEVMMIRAKSVEEQYFHNKFHVVDVDAKRPLEQNLFRYDNQKNHL